MCERFFPVRPQKTEISQANAGASDGGPAITRRRQVGFLHYRHDRYRTMRSHIYCLPTYIRACVRVDCVRFKRVVRPHGHRTVTRRKLGYRGGHNTRGRSSDRVGIIRAAVTIGLATILCSRGGTVSPGRP